MLDSPTSKPESAFVCDCDAWMREACAGEPFYKELEDKRYCVLHFPSKEKSAAFEKALQRKLENKDFNFRGVWFPDWFGTVQYDFEGDVDFGSVTFSAGSSFHLATFKAKADFSHSTFSGWAEFSGATFSAEATFVGTTFSASASFNSATFNKEGDFNVPFLVRPRTSGLPFSKRRHASSMPISTVRHCSTLPSSPGLETFPLRFFALNVSGLRRISVLPSTPRRTSALPFSALRRATAEPFSARRTSALPLSVLRRTSNRPLSARRRTSTRPHSQITLDLQETKNTRYLPTHPHWISSSPESKNPIVFHSTHSACALIGL